MPPFARFHSFIIDCSVWEFWFDQLICFVLGTIHPRGLTGASLMKGECSTWNIGFKWPTSREEALIIDEMATKPPSALCLLAERLIRLRLRCSQICFISPKREFVVLKRRLYGKKAPLKIKLGKHNLCWKAQQESGKRKQRLVNLDRCFINTVDETRLSGSGSETDEQNEVVEPSWQ